MPVEFVEPEDISATVAYLASDDSKYVTGVQLKVDAGYLRLNYSPCFVMVGNQFVVSSTLELCHNLVDLLQKEVQQHRDRMRKLTAPERLVPLVDESSRPQTCD